MSNPIPPTQLIFNFEDPIAFLNSQFRERQQKNPKFSLRAWARQMGYQNPSLLFQVLKGERRLKMDLAQKIALNLGLKGRSLRYFELIVLNGTSQTETERRVFEDMLNKLRPRHFQKMTDISVEMFAAAADWYHWAIYAMVDLPDFSPEADWIQERLNGEVDKKTIKAAIERMLRLGLLVQGEDGKLSNVDPEGKPLFLNKQVPSGAIRQYHTQMIEKAKISVEAQTVEERQLAASTISFNKSDLPKVADIIADAHRQILELADQSPAEEVYQFNTQFFRLTKKKVESTH